MNKINILIVEDDSDWLRGMREYLEKQDDLLVVSTALTKKEALSQLIDLNVDVILLDIMLGADKWGGIEIALEVHNLNKTPIIMLTSLIDEEIIIDAFAAGITNYINKSNFKDIPEAIRSAYLCQSSIHPNAAETIRSELKRTLDKERNKLLTPSEKTIITYLQKGENRLQIVSKEYITESTLKKHINKILKKLGVKSSKEAIEISRRKGMF